MNIKYLLLVLILLSLMINCTCTDIGVIKIKIGGNIMALKRIGENFTVTVSIENAVQVVGLNCWITYNPAIVEVVDMDPVTPGTQVQATDLGFFPAAQLLVGIQKDQNGNEIPGTLVCGYTALPATPKDGSGDAFSVQFKAIAAGTTDISFATGHINLQDLLGDIPTEWSGDNVNIPINATVRLTVL